MTAYFLNSSALVKRYVPETGTVWQHAVGQEAPLPYVREPGGIGCITVNGPTAWQCRTEDVANMFLR